MKRIYRQQDIPNPLDVLRKAGYSYFVDPKTNEESFVLRLTAGFYPRFHLYLEFERNTISFNLHLDQKKASYKGTSAHAGEYDGPAVEREMQRIEGWILATTGARAVNGSAEPELRDDMPSATETPRQDAPKHPKLFGGIF